MRIPGDGVRLLDAIPQVTQFGNQHCGASHGGIDVHKAIELAAEGYDLRDRVERRACGGPYAGDNCGRLRPAATSANSSSRAILGSCRRCTDQHAPGGHCPDRTRRATQLFGQRNALARRRKPSTAEQRAASRHRRASVKWIAHERSATKRDTMSTRCLGSCRPSWWTDQRAGASSRTSPLRLRSATDSTASSTRAHRGRWTRGLRVRQTAPNWQGRTRSSAGAVRGSFPASRLGRAPPAGLRNPRRRWAGPPRAASVPRPEAPEPRLAGRRSLCESPQSNRSADDQHGETPRASYVNPPLRAPSSRPGSTVDALRDACASSEYRACRWTRSARSR